MRAKWLGGPAANRRTLAPLPHILVVVVVEAAARVSKTTVELASEPVSQTGNQQRQRQQQQVRGEAFRKTIC